MNQVIKASLILTALVALLSITVQVSGLAENFVLSQLIFLVGAIALNVGVVIWALSRTAATSGYGLQVANAAGIGVVAGSLVILVSWILSGFVFPDALDTMRAGAITYMDSAGMPEAEYQRELATLEAATPMSQSVPGGIGTFFTSLVTGAVGALFLRRK